MKIQELLDQVNNQPDSVQFADVIECIESNYAVTLQAFSNGDVHNEVGTNGGSCKILAFAQLHQLSPAQTLHLFGDYYRVDVMQHPNGTDHGNIRNFMRTGWAGIEFSGPVLVPRAVY